MPESFIAFSISSISEEVLASTAKSLKETFQERYNCDNYWVSEDAKRSNGSRNSHDNNNFEQLLINKNISYEREVLIENRYYDFKVDNFLIEINPTATVDPIRMAIEIAISYQATVLIQILVNIASGDVNGM